MCEVLDRIEKRGIAQGITQGIAQGITQGIAQGKAEGLAEGAETQAKKTAINLYNMGLKPADIARAVDRSLNIVQNWLGVGMA